MSALLDCIAHLELIDEQVKAPTSLIRSFSLFSLLRGRPSEPVDTSKSSIPSSGDHADPVPVSERALAAVAKYKSRLRALKAEAPGLTEGQLAEELGRAITDCLDILAFSLQTSSTEEAGSSSTSRSSCRIALRSAFDIRAELATLPPPALSAVAEFDRHVLSAPFAPTGQYAYLGHLFARAREAILHLGHAVRASSSKSRALPPGSSQYYASSSSEHDVLWLMDMLHLLSQRVTGIDNLGYLEEVDAVPCLTSGPAKKKALSTRKQAALSGSQAAERRVKALRTGLEADVLRCELALSMANASMDSVKRRASFRARVHLAAEAADPQVDQPDAATDLDEDDLELVRSNVQADDTKAALQEEVAESETSGVHWENVAEQALIDCVVSATGCIREGHLEAVAKHITLADWIPSAVLSPGPASLVGQRQGTTVDDDIEGEDDDASSEASSDGSEDDLSHACPLRTLFRLYDRFEEQRLAVWLTLPTNTREKMGWFLRGSDGKVGSALDALGQRLLLAGMPA